MDITLLDITQDAANLIGKMAAICYDGKTDREANIRRAIHCKDMGHLATMRFAHASFRISGISRVCSHQMVRSKHLDFLQRSQRYCKETETTFVEPQLMLDDVAGVYDQHYKWCLGTYNLLLKYGVKKEDARFVLPEATCTELVVTGNFQAWQDFIKLRATKEAQWEIRQVACGISKHLAYHVPELFTEVYDAF